MAFHSTLSGIDGVDFDAAWERRVEGIVDPPSGLTTFFISKSDLLASKLAAGKPQGNHKSIPKEQITTALLPATPEVMSIV